MALTYRRHGKRVMDVVLATAGLIASAPLALAVAGAVALESGPPVLFVQDRVGQGGRVFRLMKFRSMALGTPDVPSSEVGVLEVTRVGTVIRRFNLDELPQLLNVLKGDMSLVGPRPALPSQEDLIALRRKGGAEEVKPGLTGLAQVNSFDGMSAETKARYDNEYAGSVSLVGDLRIFPQTLRYLMSPPPVY
ncbi:MAG: sugar transferase [Acidobacteriota bacterium]|nr:sugar transferase [Acidobacteriota bacterium]